MNNYEAYLPMADKLLKEDGSVQTFSGVQISPASSKGVEEYNSRSPIADKVIEPDGTIISLSKAVSSGLVIRESTYEAAEQLSIAYPNDIIIVPITA